MRVRPSTGVGAAIALGYIVIFIGLLKVFGVDLPTAFDTPENTRSVFIVMAILAGALAIVTTILGWWRPVLHENRRLRGWFRFVPAVFAVVILAGIDYGGFAELGGELVLWIGATTLLIGFSEEIVYRALALLGFRGSMSEVGAWFWATLAFGFLHLPNILVGAEVGPTVFQVGMAFVAGTVFYLVRRATGLLVVTMLLHAAFDFSAFTGSVDYAPSRLQVLILIPVFIGFLATWKHAFPTTTESQGTSTT